MAQPEQGPLGPEVESEKVQSALRLARAQLGELAQDGSSLAADLLAFQIALTEDAELTRPALVAIAAGEDAGRAWRGALDTEIDAYRRSGDEYFAQRAQDLVDLRDRVSSLIDGALTPPPPQEGSILVVDELTPSRFLEVDWKRYAGVVSSAGGITSHVAMLARARGVPMLIGPKVSSVDTDGGTPAILDAVLGVLILDPEPATFVSCAGRRRARAGNAAAALSAATAPAISANGVPVAVYLNVDDPGRLAAVSPDLCDGIGLTRTEFLFRAGEALPDEEAQLRIYRQLLDWAGGRPVTIRTLDAGGDKPIPGLTPEGEQNPFLGVRGLRLSLRRPEIFAVQLRALARAAPSGNLKVMVPMVTRPEELAAARMMMVREVEALTARGIAAAMPAFGMMVEVPAAALTAADFAADFLSIGTNDLLQYLAAAGRDRAELADLQDPLQPAMLAVIAQVAAAGRARGVEVSVCGEMAGLPHCVPALLKAGIRALSVAATAAPAVKAAIRAAET